MRLKLDFVTSEIVDESLNNIIGKCRMIVLRYLALSNVIGDLFVLNYI